MAIARVVLKDTLLERDQATSALNSEVELATGTPSGEMLTETKPDPSSDDVPAANPARISAISMLVVIKRMPLG